MLLNHQRRRENGAYGVTGEWGSGFAEHPYDFTDITFIIRMELKKK